MPQIDNIDSLRKHYGKPHARAIGKEVSELDVHCSQFIQLSPFCILSSVKPDGLPDISPRGGSPGFVRVIDKNALLMADGSGNNRLDTLGNLTNNPAVAILFLIPGFDETLRVYGTVAMLGPGEFEGVSSGDGRPAKTALKIDVTKAYFHCGKALIRADLWGTESLVERSMMPSLGQIVNDQMGDPRPGESHEEVRRIYREEMGFATTDD